jgi:hypothetical protein
MQLLWIRANGLPISSANDAWSVALCDPAANKAISYGFSEKSHAVTAAQNCSLVLSAWIVLSERIAAGDHKGMMPVCDKDQ